jgi:hypothetical protein
MPKDKGKRKSQSEPSKVPDKSSKGRSSKGRSSKGHTKKKRRTGGNVAGGSKAVDPKHNAKVNSGLITSFVYDEVNPDLEVACKREIHVKGSYLKLRDAQAKAVFTFQVRRYTPAHEFKDRGVDDVMAAFKLKDVTDYDSPAMTAIFGKDELQYDHIWMPVFPTYTIIRHSTWEHNKGARMLALRQKDAYDNKRADLLADRGAQRVATQMVSKTAAEVASKITTTGGPITQFTSVNKRGNVGGKKMLRGASTNEGTIVSQWTRTGRYVDKVDANGKPYRVEVLLNVGPEDLAVDCSAGASCNTYKSLCAKCDTPKIRLLAVPRRVGLWVGLVDFEVQVGLDLNLDLYFESGGTGRTCGWTWTSKSIL